MSAIPARTRSTRQPAGTASTSRPGNLSSSAAKDDAVQRSRADSTRLAENHHTSPSPSRLPTVKPITRSNTIATPTTRHSKTSSISRTNVAATTSSRARPAIPQKSSPNNTTRNTRAGSVSNSSNVPSPSSSTMRPPPRPLRSSTAPNNSMPPPPRPRSVNSNRPSNNPPVTRSTGIKHTRNQSESTIASPRAGHTRAPSLQTSALTSLRQPKLEGPRSPGLKKPGFSTLQQHYSPLKNPAPKATTAAILAPPTPSKLPENIAKSAEISRLQAELLQLHLLHKDSAGVDCQWHESAKSKLNVNFTSVVATQKDLLDEEAAQQKDINAEAFKVWAESIVPGWGLEERCQVLEEVLTGVWSLSEGGGKYLRLVRKFERWIAKVEGILNARQTGDGNADFVEGLDKGWNEDCAVLLRKLERWKGRMKELGDNNEAFGKSSVGAVVRGARALVEGMEEEISMMGRIQREAVEREDAWMRAQNDEDDLDDERSRTEGTGNHHGIWRL